MVAENVKNARSAKKEGEGKDLENVVEIASSEGRRYVCVDVCVVVSPQCVLLNVPPFFSRRAHPTSGEGAPQTHKKKRVVSKAFISTSESSEEEEAKVEVKKKEEEEEEEVEEVEEGKMVEGTATTPEKLFVHKQDFFWLHVLNAPCCYKVLDVHMCKDVPCYS